MREINEAYDALMKNAGGSYQYTGQGYEQSYDNSNASRGIIWAAVSGQQQQIPIRSGYNTQYQHENESDLENKGRMYINSGNIARLRKSLDRMHVRNAAWYYLQGLIFLRRGWYDRGYTNIQKAANMDPANFEYRNALNNLNQQSAGYSQNNYHRDTAITASPDMCNFV
jgi:molecular chaperone DnaJ